MKIHSNLSKREGLTLIELLVVIALIAILAAMLLPATTHGGKARIPWCMNNQKQIDLGFIMYAGDNNGKFPMQFSTTNGGTMEFVRSGNVFQHIQKLSQYYGRNTGILVCPSDVERHAATNFERLNDYNISYSLNADASTNNQSLSILTGDRHLEANGKAVRSGLFVCSTNTVLNWTRELHNSDRGRAMGVLSFADGHVQLTRKQDLNSFFHSQAFATNWLCVP